MPAHDKARAFLCLSERKDGLKDVMQNETKPVAE